MPALKQPDVPAKKMNFDEFMEWYETAEGKWELHDGIPVRLHDPALGQAERFGHSRSKARIFAALEKAVNEARLDCEVLPDGMAIKIDGDSSYEPDAQVYCGARRGDDELVVPNPVIVVEVLSPSTIYKDLNDKVRGYFSLESIMHYLISDPVKQTIVHYYRSGEDIIYKPITKTRLQLDH